MTLPHVTGLEQDDTHGQSLDKPCGVPMEFERFLRLAVEIAAALAELHGRSIIHKNIKPSNILINPETGAATVIDFSVASRLPIEDRALLKGDHL